MVIVNARLDNALLLFRSFSRRKFSKILLFSVLIISAWIFGLYEHCFEVSFAKFEWPPYTNIREQVRLELSGEPATVPFENDWKNIKTVITPSCFPSLDFKVFRNFLLIIVKSKASNIQNRFSIRSTWGAVSNYSDFLIQTIFLVAEVDNSTDNQLMSLLQFEADQYKDILMTNHIDNYRNNTLKFMSAIKYAYDYCMQSQTVPFAFLVDDDYYVSIKNLLKEVKRHKTHDRLYSGWKFVTSPFRNRLSKHYVSLQDYPFDHYPPYITAGAVLLSRQSIRELYFAAQHVRFFRYDDVYCGILAHFLGLRSTHNALIRFWMERISVEDLSHLICAHGFSPLQLNDTYNRLLKIGYV